MQERVHTYHTCTYIYLSNTRGVYCPCIKLKPYHTGNALSNTWAGTTFDTIPRFNTSMTQLSRSVYTFKGQYTPYIWDTNIPIQGHQTIIIISYTNN